MSNQTASQVFIARAQSNEFKGNSDDVLSFLQWSPLHAQAFDAAVSVEEASRPVFRVKPALRLAQATAFVADGIVEKGKRGSAKKSFNEVTAIAIAIVAQAPIGQRIAFADAHRYCGMTVDAGKGDGLINGVSKARLNKFLGLITNPGTVKSMVSRTVGENGFLKCLGIVDNPDGNSFRIVNREHPFIKLYCDRIARLTDGQISVIEQQLIDAK